MRPGRYHPAQPARAGPRPTPGTDSVAGQTNIAAAAHRDIQRRTRATGICQRICKAHVFDETFGVNSAFNAEVFVAPTHAVAMEFDLFGERRSGHWAKGGAVSKRELLIG